MRVARGFLSTARIVASAILVFTSACTDHSTVLGPRVASAPRTSATSQAALTTVFGPRRFVRQTGKPVTETIAISTVGLGSPLTLHVRSGDAGGAHPVASGFVTLDGDTLIRPAMLNRAGSWSFSIAPGAVASLAVRLGGAPGGILDIWIEGVPVSPPVLSASISSTDFGVVLVGMTSAPRTVTVSNTGGSATKVLAFSLTGANPTQFIVAAGTCAGVTLAPGASCDATLSFAPTGSTGARTATATVSDGVVSVSLPVLQGTATFSP